MSHNGAGVLTLVDNGVVSHADNGVVTRNDNGVVSHVDNGVVTHVDNVGHTGLSITTMVAGVMAHVVTA